MQDKKCHKLPTLNMEKQYNQLVDEKHFLGIYVHIQKKLLVLKCETRISLTLCSRILSYFLYSQGVIFFESYTKEILFKLPTLIIASLYNRDTVVMSASTGRFVVHSIFTIT